MLSFNFSKIYFKIYAIVQLFQKGLLQELISNRFLKKIDWSQSYRSEPFRHCSTHRHCSHICSSSIDSTFLVSGLSVFIDMKFKTGRLNSKRRKTILRENNIFDILKKFESLTQSEKNASLQFHLMEIGTLSKKISVRNIRIACRHLPKLN